MNANHRRPFFWVLLALYIGWAVAAMLYFPFDRQKLYRAIPAHATFISEHVRLAERWPSLSADPMIRGLVRCLGVEGQKADGMLADPEFGRTIARVARRHTIVAYVPSTEVSAPPAWVFASWLGSRSIVLRAQLAAGAAKGYRRIELNGGKQAWMFRPKRGSGWILSLAVVEGMLLGCYSPDPRSVQSLVDRVECVADPSPELRRWLETSAAVDQTDGGARSAPTPFDAAWDRGWIQWRHREADRYEPRWLRFALDPQGTGATTGWLGGNLGLSFAEASPPDARDGQMITASVANRTNALDELVALLGDAAGGVAVMPFAGLESCLQAACEGGIRQSVAALLRTNVDRQAPAFICVCATNYGGRLMGLRVPTVLAGVRVEDPGKAQEMIASALDVLNARYAWGLIPAKAGDEDPVILLDAVNEGAYQRLGPRERPAFAVAGRWLIFSSNVEALTRILGDRRIRKESGARWLPPAARSGRRAFLWVDLAAAHEALIKSLAVHDLLMYGQDESRRRGVWSNLDMLATWIEKVRPLNALTAEVDPREGEIEAKFRVQGSGFSGR